jgi:hypothetical protein|tara:strand:+ start:262 stop:594 length:333 start_codon:yes stop_codon:yes gene_type:complete
MGKQTIHPTNHAIDRFEERVLPFLSKHTQTKMIEKKEIKSQLYGLVSRSDFITKGSQTFHVEAIMTIKGDPPIPLTLVINPVKNILVTLYITSGWEIDSANKQSVWRWCA